MASNIENIEGIIKEEVIYADVADVPGLYHVVQSGECFVHEDGTVVNGADVQCQEIVIDAEDNGVFPKYEIVETDGNVYGFDPNSTVSSSAQYFAFNSGSESSPMKRDASQASSNNSFDNNNYIASHHSKDRLQRGQTLREKQLELNNIKQFGTRLRNIKQDQDDWSPNNERETYRDDNQMGDDDYDGDYGSRRRSFGRIGSRTSKPKKRVFAYRLQWRDEDMMQAMDKVNDHSMTIRGAAKHFNVPYSTLKDRVRGRVTHGTKPGVKTALSPMDEHKLVRIVNHMVACGFNIQCLDIREKAHEILKTSSEQVPQLPNMPGHNWLSGFLKRHPEAKVNRPSGRIASPSTSKISSLVKRFFEVSSRVYRTIDGGDKPSRIYCMTSIQLQSLPKNTLILTASADGSLFPPFVFGNFDYGSLPLMHQAFPGAMFVTSSDMSRERLLLQWFIDFFLPKANLQTVHNVQKPYVLFLNQSNRYVSVELVERSMANNVSLICMPTNLTQALQPLNSLSTTLEQYYQKCLKWVILNGVNLNHSEINGEVGPELSDVQVAQTLKKLFDKSELFREEIKKNFSDTGVYPLNIRAVSLEKISTSSNEDDYLGNFNESYDDNQDDYARDNGDGIQDEGGLHLLCELSTRNAARNPHDSSLYDEKYSNQLSRHPSTYKYKSSSGYNQGQNERRTSRMKRSAAGESERFMKKILGDGMENDYGDDGERHSKRARIDESDDCSITSLDSEIGGCARVRPIKSNNKQLDSLSNETASEFDGRDLYRPAVEDKKSSNRHSMRESQRLHSNSYNINDSVLISQAVASILPKEELFYQDNSNIKLPTPFIKTPKLQYVLKRPNQRPVQNIPKQSTTCQSHQVGYSSLELSKQIATLPIKVEEIVDMHIQEEVITSDLDQYFVQNPQLVSEEVTVEEIVMDDIVTAIYDEEPASDTVESLLFKEQSSNGAEDAAMLNINCQAAEELANSVVVMQSEGLDHVPPTGDGFVIDYDVAPVSNEEQSISNEDIKLGNGVYKASQMVKMTTHLKLNNHPVQIIRSVTLREAMETIQRSDPKVIKCNLEFIKS